MLSVVIATHDSERALVPTLAALVAGAAAGMVQEVIVADAGSRDATAAIADGTGCRVLTSTQARGARLKAAAEAARAPWLLFFSPGTVPDATWIDETRRFIEQAELRGGGKTHAATGGSAFSPCVAARGEHQRSRQQHGQHPFRHALIPTRNDQKGGWIRAAESLRGTRATNWGRPTMRFVLNAPGGFEGETGRALL